MTAFQHLFTPLKVGPITVKNRILVPSHGTQMAQEGRVTDQMTSYVAERAKGGASLIVTEAMSVHPTSRQRPNVVYLYNRDCIPSLRKLTDKVHSYGAFILCQIHHGGREQQAAWSQQAPWAPSPLPDPLHQEVPHEMSTDEIREVVRAFAYAAETAVLGGYDGVEVICGHGYLVNQFLSPWSNRRSDEYGGSLENRLRFGREVLRAVRQQLKHKVVGIRVNSDEYRPEGNGPEECRRIALALAAEGADYINVSAGHQTMPWTTYPPMGTPMGPNVPFAAAVKKEARVPVFVAHRIKTVEYAEEIIARGDADMVGMARAHIADPELANKAKEGRAEDIRPCIGAMQGCGDRGRLGFHLGCTVNPAVGHEAEYVVRPATTKKTIAVVGGGPAGLEAARVLSLRGHLVHLFELSSSLGGKVLFAASLPDREEFMEIIDWYSGQLTKHGVQVHLRRNFIVETAKDTAFDAVILATGGDWRPPVPYNPDVPHLGVIEAVQVDGDLRGQHVLIVDREHHNKGLNLALKLAGMKADVLVIAEGGHQIAQNLDATNKGVAMKKAAALGIRTMSNAQVLEVSKSCLRLSHEGSEMSLPGVGLVVVVEKPVAESTLEKELRSAHPGMDIRVIGDCSSPRLCIDAIHDGHRVALQI